MAGSFYPETKEKINQLLDKFIKPEQNKIPIKAIIVPHAGYMFSGEIAGKAFSKLNRVYKDIIIMTPNHTVPCDFAALDLRDYKTPLGIVKNSPTTKKLSKENNFKVFEEAHDKEHAIEVILPFLQKKLKNFKIIPIIVGETNTKEISESISKFIKPNTLLIVSTDLSHFHEYEEAVSLDKKTVDAVKNLKEEDLGEACGINSLKVLIEIAKNNNWSVEILNYKNSGDIILAKSSVVGYMSAVLY